MNITLRMPLLISLACTLLLAACERSSEHTIGALRIDDAWLRAGPPGAPVVGGFITIRNLGDHDDRLVAVRSNAARKIEIHEMRVDDNDMMKMRELVDGLRIPAGSKIELRPGSEHLMWIGPTRALLSGEQISATLQFEHAGETEVHFVVRAADAASAGQGHHH